MGFGWLLSGDHAQTLGQGLGAERGSDAGLDAVPAQERGDLRGVGEHVLVVLAVAPPGAVGVGHERGDVADEPVRRGLRELRDDGPVIPGPAQAPVVPELATSLPICQS